MNYYVDGWTNFCRVFELPEKFPTGFCTGGGLPTTFLMVDWFNPVPGIGQPAVSRNVWLDKFQNLEGMEKQVDGGLLQISLTDFLRPKNYVKPGKTYVVICDFGFAFTFKGRG